MPIRLSAEERALFQTKADEQGLTYTGWVRKALLSAAQK